jgi:hypothetical protein
VYLITGFLIVAAFLFIMLVMTILLAAFTGAIVNSKYN